MANLIITVIGIVLFVAISSGGIAYIDTDLISRSQNQELVNSGFVKLIAKYHIYKKNNSEVVHNNASNWIDTVDKPRAPNGTDWNYVSNADGNYFCLSGEMYSEDFLNNTHSLLKQSFSSLFTNNSCGATTNNLSYVEGGSKAFTVWLDSRYKNILNIYMENALTGEEIITNNKISVYNGEDFFINLTISSSDANVVLTTIPADTTAVFICGDGSIGCNSGENRILKINTSNIFDNRQLVINTNDTQYTVISVIIIKSKDKYVCNPANPLLYIETDINGNYLIGSSIGDLFETKDQLLCISNNQTPAVLLANYRLMTDVTFSASEDWDNSGIVGDAGDSEGWIPLGNSSDFVGDFDGSNKVISNLFINRSDSSQGFFGSVNGSTIKDLGLSNVNITGNDNSGGLIGSSSNSIIDFTYVTGNINGNDNTGGLIGVAINNIITNSYAIGNINANDSVGGLVGLFDDSVISTSYTANNVTGNDKIGGLVGEVIGTSVINNSYTTGDVGLKDNIGGLIGTSSSNTQVNNAYTTGNITGNNYVGSLIGNDLGAIVIKSYAINNNITAISGVPYDIDNYCSYDFDASCLIEYRIDSIKYGWSDSIWENMMDDSPLLEWQVDGYITTPEPLDVCNTEDPLSGIEQDIYGNYLIGGSAGNSTAAKEDLLCISNNQIAGVLSANYKLTSNITFSASEDWDGSGIVGDGTDAEGWEPLGSSSTPFIGNFDGNAHIIDNLYINRPGKDFQGLFGYTSNATISSLGLDNVDITGDDYVGGFSGYRGTITNSYIKGSVTGDWNVGGFISSRGVITNSYATADVSASHDVGGLTGEHTIITNSYTTGNISGNDSHLGSITGHYSGTITKSYAIDNDLTATGLEVFDIDNYCSYSFDYGCNIDYKTASIKDGWDDSIWESLEDESPKLEWEVAGDIDSVLAWVCIVSTPLIGIELDVSGTTYLIGGSEGNSTDAKNQMLCLSNNQTSDVLSASYKLMADVNFLSSSSEDWNNDGVVNNSDRYGWVAMGDNKNRFIGNFDGNDKIIRNLFIDEKINYQGLFGYAEGAIIKNIGLNNVYVKTKNSRYLGGLLGYGDNMVITNSYMRGDIAGTSSYMGGLIGYVNNSNLSNLHSSIDIITNKKHVGGLIGYLNNSNLTNSYSVGIDVNSGIDSDSTSMGNIGGLVGIISNSYVSNSYSTINVSGIRNNIGGLIGSISNSTVEKTYATGIVDSSRRFVGGLIGQADNTIINNSYYDAYDNTPPSYNVSGKAYVGGLVGRIIRNSEVNNSYANGIIDPNANKVGALVGTVNNGSSINSSYALNNILEPVDNLSSDNNNYCSSTYDGAGCIPTDINLSWDTLIWTDIGTNTPNLLNMP